MSKYRNQISNKKNNKSSFSMVNSIKILSEMTKKDIAKSYNLETINGTETHYSNRYGWTLRRSAD